LQATALVHEAWLRLAGSEHQSWQNRAHFFAAAAEAMRRILVEHARRKQSLKRGSGSEHVELNESMLVLTAPPDELLAVHEALDKLALRDSAAAELVKLRYFIGMTMGSCRGAQPEQADGQALDLRRVWLHREIVTEGPGSRPALPSRFEEPPPAGCAGLAAWHGANPRSTLAVLG
jgi:RNA polymerase sigma factor (TIGR02999 family)